MDTSVTKQAINALRVLEKREQLGALSTLLDKDNLDVLSPVFVTLMRAVRGIYDGLTDTGKATLDTAMIRIYDECEHILSVELNLAYYLQALARKHSDRKEEILVEIYEKHTSPIVRRIIIAAMAQWKCDFWLTDLKGRYASLHEWEQRAVIVASYSLGDEGSHWRRHTRKSWSKMDTAVRDWFSSRSQTNSTFPT